MLVNLVGLKRTCKGYPLPVPAVGIIFTGILQKNTF